MLRLAVLSLVLSVALCNEVVEITEEVKQTFLDRHNTIRRTVNSVDLVWDEEIAKFAAEKTGAADCKFAHTSPSKFPEGVWYGENLFWRWPIITNGTNVAIRAVRYWGNEVVPYGEEAIKKNWKGLCFPNPVPAGHKQCGHYTQEVWKDTRKVGCAITACTEKKAVLVVCNYSPPGNYAGQEPF